MVLFEYDGVDAMVDERLESVTVLAVHGSRGLAFVRTKDGRVRTARTCGREYHRGTVVEMFDTGVLY